MIVSMMRILDYIFYRFYYCATKWGKKEDATIDAVTFVSAIITPLFYAAVFYLGEIISRDFMLYFSSNREVFLVVITVTLYGSMIYRYYKKKEQIIEAYSDRKYGKVSSVLFLLLVFIVFVMGGFLLILKFCTFDVL